MQIQTNETQKSLNNQEKYHYLTLQALKEVENGNTVPHSQILTWIDNLPEYAVTNTFFNHNEI
ncbi:MAG: hypothetical protein IKZ88_04630 [Neisseriaceae bacterium]|nr:hypothetical protein [Neisseriaceae bacterium]